MIPRFPGSYSGEGVPALCNAEDQLPDMIPEGDERRAALDGATLEPAAPCTSALAGVSACCLGIKMEQQRTKVEIAEAICASSEVAVTI